MPPAANVRLFRFNVVAAGVHVLPVKSSLLNQLPVVIVGIEAPLVIDRLGALLKAPPVVPNVNVLVTEASETNPPVTLEKLKLVASAILNTVLPRLGVANIILLFPNIICRLVVPDALIDPTVKSYPPRFNVPANT